MSGYEMGESNEGEKENLKFGTGRRRYLCPFPFTKRPFTPAFTHAFIVIFQQRSWFAFDKDDWHEVQSRVSVAPGETMRKDHDPAAVQI